MHTRKRASTLDYSPSFPIIPLMISCAVYKSAFSLGLRYRVLTTPALFSNTQRANKTQEEGGGCDHRILNTLELQNLILYDQEERKREQAEK